jgi:hypothetical protein
MKRQQIYNAINKEREYQNTLWGQEFDIHNTADDWTTFITFYATRNLVKKEFNQDDFILDMVKVAALAVAAIETCSKAGKFPPRHWEKEEIDVKT